MSGTKRSFIREAGGALGDLGTFVPYVIGAMTVAGLPPIGVLFGFGVTLIASGLFYGLPIAVQPMKAVSAVMLTGGLSPGDVAGAGLVLGFVFLALGLTGSIGWLARVVPQSVGAGLQLGLGISMGIIGIGLIAETPWLGLLALGALLALMRRPGLPAAPAAILLTCAAAYFAGQVTLPEVSFAWRLPTWMMPSWPEILRGFEHGVIPQLPLTLTNAILVTALVAGDLFPDRKHRATERNLALSTGLANLALAPIGAMPMCHGAGGLQAQHRFGARTGLAPVLFGALLLVIALGFSNSAVALFNMIPAGVVGALLLVAGADLALTRRLFDARPACWPAIAITAAGSVALNPAVGLFSGWMVEFGRELWKRRRTPADL